MKCRKQLILTGYRVQYVDLRQPKPRTPQELIHVADRQWLDAMGLVGRNVADHIKSLYEKEGYKVFSIEPLKPKRVVELDLCRLWEEAEPPISEETAADQRGDRHQHHRRGGHHRMITKQTATAEEVREAFTAPDVEAAVKEITGIIDQQLDMEKTWELFEACMEAGKGVVEENAKPWEKMLWIARQAYLFGFNYAATIHYEVAEAGYKALFCGGGGYGVTLIPYRLIYTAVAA